MNTARDFSVAKDAFSKQNIPTEGDSSEDLRRRWVESTIRRVAQQECAAAGCNKGGDCFGTESEHPAVYEAAETVCGCAPVLETQLSALEREAFFDVCAKYRPMIRLMYDDGRGEGARGLLESLLNAAPVEGGRGGGGGEGGVTGRTAHAGAPLRAGTGGDRGPARGAGACRPRGSRPRRDVRIPIAGAGRRQPPYV